MSVEIDAIIDRYLKDPENPEAWEAAKAPEVFAVFARRCRDLVISNPANALAVLRRGIPIVTCPCDLARIFGQISTCYRGLGDLATAFQVLDSAFLWGEGCKPCRADLLIRRALAHGAARNLDAAISDADEAIALYRALEGQPDHDLHGNGFAKAFHARGDIRQYIGIPLKDEGLIAGAAEDFTTALNLTDPNISPALYRLCLTGLAAPLYASGSPDDLERAYGYLVEAQRRMNGAKKASQERAKLAWILGMVQNAIMDSKRGMRPAKVRRKLRRALSDFVKIGMSAEAAAVASDLCRLAFPDRSIVRELLEEFLELLERRFELPDVADRLGEFAGVRKAVVAVLAACDLSGWDAHLRLRESLESLREVAAEPLACLIPWKEAE